MLSFDLKLFVLLQFTLVFDWTVQTHWEATNKTISSNARYIHSTIYALLSYGLIWLYGYRGMIGFGIFLVLKISHYLIDDRKFVVWWMRNIKRMKMSDDELRRDYWWLTIGIDQCLHTLTNFAIATYLQTIILATTTTTSL